MFPTDNMTEAGRACSPSSHVQITPSRSCGWVGGDREIREILDLLDVRAPSSVEWFFFSICPDFCFYLFCWHASRNGVSVQVTVLAGLVWCSVLHWSNFSTHHIPPPPSVAPDTCLFCTGFMSNSEVRVGDDGNEVILFLFVNACMSIIQLYWITGATSIS